MSKELNTNYNTKSCSSYWVKKNTYCFKILECPVIKIVITAYFVPQFLLGSYTDRHFLLQYQRTHLLAGNIAFAASRRS